MRKAIVMFLCLSVCLLIVPAAFAVDVTVNTYLDAGYTNPSDFFGNGSYVYFTAYNGVSCCDSKTADVSASVGENLTTKILVNLSDANNNGLYSGFFQIGTDNQTEKYLHVENNQNVLIKVSLTPLSSGSKPIKSEYDAPGAVNLSARFLGGVVLSWTNSTDESGIAHYNVYRSQQMIDTGNLKSATAFVSFEIKYMDKDMVDGRTYYYAVAAVDKVGNVGELSNIASVFIPDVTPPNAVSDLHLTALAGGKVRLDWTTPNDNVGVVNYLVYRSESSFDNVGWVGMLDNITSVGGESYSDDKTSDGRRYYYALIAVDAAGNKAKLSNVPWVLADASSPEKVKDLKAVLGKAGLVSLSWSAVRDVGANINNNASAYKIYRSRYEIKSKNDIVGLQAIALVKPANSKSQSDSYDTQGSYDTNVSFSDTNNLRFSEVRDGLTYYVVTAVDEAGNEGDISNVVKVEPDLTPPQAVSGLIAAADLNKKVILKWKASVSSDVQKYYIYRFETVDGNCKAISGCLPENISFDTPFAITDKTEFNDTNVVKDKTYYYIVHAVDAAGNEDGNTVFVYVTAIDSVVDLYVVYPKNNSAVSQDKITVVGKTDSDAKVFISNNLNGTEFAAEAVVDSNGVFIGYIPLMQGENLVSIETIDSSGNIKREKIFVSSSFGSSASKSDIDNALNSVKEYVVNGSFSSDNLIETLEKNDPNLAGKRGEIQDLITGSAVFGISDVTLAIVIVLIVAVILIFVYSHRVLKRDVLALIRDRLRNEKQEQLQNNKKNIDNAKSYSEPNK